MGWLLKLFASAPFLPEISNTEEVKEKYKYWRIRIMYSMFIGYSLYYLTRKSFTYVMPSIIEELHFTKAQLGVMGTLFAIVYGISKFFSGVWSDQSNPRYFMAIGLIVTGVVNICFGFSSSLWIFIVFWGLNGWFQGFGWPPCVKLLSNWYSHSERGSWWSSWAVSQNVGAFITPWFISLCCGYFGWRYGMFFPGIICILGGFFLLNRLADVPQTLGLPSVEKFRNDYPEKKKGESNKKASSKEMIMGVLKNKYIWALSLAYFFIYFARAGIADWTTFFMMESKGYTLVQAAGSASLVEVGGFFGMVSAGWASDRIFKAKRGPVNALYALLILLSILAFWCLPQGYKLVECGLLFVIGFAIFGPQMLIGVAVSELANKNSTATATGFAGWIAYLGAAAAGCPLGKIIDLFGWDGFFLSLIVCSAIAVLFLLPLWNVTSVKEKKSSQEKILA